MFASQSLKLNMLANFFKGGVSRKPRKVLLVSRTVESPSFEEFDHSLVVRNPLPNPC